ncbi:hypothetical protein MUY27_00330 [Mucilaginibacter sp. RS28]|uniref:Uncharacterized protein n=1 Tax=Mucilaginibacter straminoryzae TaxID=2932774 RepID=A0A9X1X012_9SPHI|nr:hypothetical protein [Mucilaginibacter straminoryzae]MCJ8208131.1 hypothetical protein [Mucilaginibacter straminoryzae]
MMETTFESIKNTYITLGREYNTKRDDLNAKIERAQRRIVKLEQQRKKLKFPFWTELLLRPVLNLIKIQLPGWSCDDEHLNPMGLGCRVSVFFTKTELPDNADPWKEGNSIYIVFVPVDLSIGLLHYETGESEQRYPTGTIGAINGFNRKTKPLESVQEAVDFLKRQADHVQSVD